MAVKRSKSRGRDLRHTETQAGIDISRKVEGERGRTNGVEKIGAVSAAKPGLNRRKPRTKVATNLTRNDIINGEKGRDYYPDMIHVTKDKRLKMRVYYREV